MTDDLVIRPEVRRMATGDEEAVLAAALLFDHPLNPAAVRALLASPTDHLLLAFLGGEAAGFVLAHELPRLDGPPELFLYELATDPAHQRRGVARALINELKAIGRQLGARSLFVLTHAANRPAMACYAATGGSSAGEEANGIVMFDYDLG